MTRSAGLSRWPWAVLAAIVLVALAGPWLAGHDPYAQDLLARNQPPSPAHWLGTDNFGRDLLSRLVAGTGLTLLVALGASLLALVGGAGLGIAACALGRPARAIVFAGFDIVRTLPAILLALALMVAMGVGTASVILAVGVAFMPQFGYVARAVYERETASGYVLAARTLGVAPATIAWRHIMPNAAGALLTQLAIILPRTIVTESVLSFFGLGVSPDEPTWGRIIATAVPYAERAPSALLFPVLALALTSLALSLAGNQLRLRYDPLQRPTAAQG
ncbi:ABC transporter permease [Verticiella sediminum]|uniref:ABC transporter permease n=1 Tax=Verticiella sediminum TaxID=1247510 RepID=A0A556AIS5_9BURK|nr:ABC transporter permease [Verticiella sediminum]TSH92770.1 ABC transporter permease [Verticiella sediminum]